MSKSVLVLFAAGLCLLLATAAMAAETVSVKISGPGRVNDTTIKAGQKVSFDIYFNNETKHTGVSLGFKFTSPDKTIKTVVHPADEGKGMEPSKGDIKAYGVFEGKTVFQVLNQPVLSDWNDTLPEVMGFMTMVMRKRFEPQPVQKNFSIDMVVPTPGTLVMDSSFFPPGGLWIFTGEGTDAPTKPKWTGPYKFKVVK